jgi:hypothetical protein
LGPLGGHFRLNCGSKRVTAARVTHAERQVAAAKAVMAVVMGKGLHSSEMGELLHLLRHVGHAVKEAFDTFVEGPEENNGRRR